MKLGDITTDEYRQLFHEEVGPVLAEVVHELVLPMISAAITQSEMRVIQLLSDRMDKKFDQVEARFAFIDKRLDDIEYKMSDGFRGVAEALEVHGTIIDSNDKKLDKRIRKLSKRTA